MENARKHRDIKFVTTEEWKELLSVGTHQVFF